MKEPVSRRSLGEIVCPSGVKVDGVGQDKARERVNSIRRNQVINPVFGLVADSVIDGDA